MKIGDIIDSKYEILSLIGRGGMGEVFKARHLVIGRLCALKFLKKDVKHKPESMTRFRREAEATSAIGSENTVDVTDIGFTEQGVPFLVMEYLEGKDLAQEIEKTGPFEFEFAVEVSMQSAQALSLAHDAGIIHRDLKPSNIFLTKRDDGTPLVKILDFGIAKFLDDTDNQNIQLTETNATLGTPGYMSPEQARGGRDIDERSDVYSLGAILYELVTGHPPFRGQNINEQLILVATEDPVPPSKFRPDINKKLEDFILRAMARDRDKRFQSMKEFIVSLLDLGNDDVCHSNKKTGFETLQRLKGWRKEAAIFLLFCSGFIGILFMLDWGQNSTVEPNVKEEMMAKIAQLPPESHPEHTLSPKIELKKKQEFMPQTVQIKVSVEPEDAMILIDNSEVEGNPFSGLFFLDKIQHKIEIKSEGYKDVSKLIGFDRNQEIMIELEAIKRIQPTRPRPIPHSIGRQTNKSKSLVLDRINPYIVE